jgi:hypothetical protein
VVATRFADLNGRVAVVVERIATDKTVTLSAYQI